MIEDVFKPFFDQYKNDTKKSTLTYVVTSRDRKGGAGNPHATPGNAMDLTLRTNGQYSAIKEYNDLLKYMFDNWQYRAGMDNTPNKTRPDFPGNVHIHIDLGMVMPPKQTMPFFFIEDNGVFQKRITNKNQIV